MRTAARQEPVALRQGAQGRSSDTLRTAALAPLLLLVGLVAGCDRLGGQPEQAAETDIGPVTTQHNRETFVTRTEIPLSVQDASNLYERHCAVCHGQRGRGGVGPALAGNGNLASSSYVVARIQLGGGGMPPFARLLSAREIGATASFIRTSWENEYGTVSEDQVDLQWNGYRRDVAYGSPLENR